MATSCSVSPYPLNESTISADWQNLLAPIASEVFHHPSFECLEQRMIGTEDDVRLDTPILRWPKAKGLPAGAFEGSSYRFQRSADYVPQVSTLT